MTQDSDLWANSSAEIYAAQDLRDDTECDLVIIGAGYTGLSAALCAAEAGARVVVCEAQTVGYGGSGRNVGLVNAGLWLPPKVLAKTMGVEDAVKLTQALGDGPQLVFDLIERHRIECEPVRNGTLHCAHSQRAVAGLQERQRQLAATGAPVRLLKTEEARAKVGSQTVFGALHDARAGTIQPLAYARGLARAAVKAGAHIYENTPVSGINKDSDGWRITANGHVVRAKSLLIATNAYHADIRGISIPQTTKINYFQCATAPISANFAGSILAGGEGCWDTRLIMSSWRKDTAGRVIIGAMGRPEGFGRALHHSWAKRKLAELFPQIAGTPFEHHWHGQIAMSHDKIPKLLNIGPQGVAVYGYSGRGIAPGTVIGRAVAQYLTGGAPEILPLKPVETDTEHGALLRGVVFETSAIIAHAAQR